MPVTHPALVRSAFADLVCGQINEGTPPGQLVMLTAGGATVATLTFADPAFADAVAGVSTANPIVADTNAAGGTIAKAELRNAAGTPKVLCSVTATGGGGDIQLSSVVVSPGQTVSMSALSYAATP